MTLDDFISQAEAANLAQTDVPRMDEEAFASFYHQTARAVWAYLVRVSGNAALADDLLQESYLRFLCAAGRRNDDEESCRRYLFRIASNLLRDHWRRPATTALDEVPETVLVAADHRISEHIDSRAMLGPAFAQMKARERQLLWLAYAEGCTHQEIAQITGLGAASIRILLFRAKRKLARLLRQAAQAPGENQ